MIIVMKPNAPESAIQSITQVICSKGLQTHLSQGEQVTIIGVVGDKRKLNNQNIEVMPYVDKIVPITESYKLTNKKFHPQASRIKVGNYEIGPNTLTIMAGPCAVETEEQLMEIARAVKKAGAQFVRGGAYKPRTSPYDFQGYGEKALKYLKQASEATGLLTVSEVMDASDLEMMCEYIDVLQIGARNVQNFKLLQAVGRSNKPVILKRGLASTIREFLLAAEHIMYQGNTNVILCERGIRSFDSAFTRNVMDIASIPVIKKYSHLPIIVDPSHGTGQRYLIEPMAKAGLVVGADGIMIEVHHDPENALSDGKQSLPIPMFKEVMRRLNQFNDRLHYEKNSLSANVD